MNRLWSTDGSDRKLCSTKETEELTTGILESDFRVLTQRALEMMRRLRYVNRANRLEGTFYDLFRCQPLIVLTEISARDIDGGLRLFARAEWQERKQLVAALDREMKDWDNRLAYYQHLRLAVDIHSRPGIFREAETEEEIKKNYYILTGILRKLRGNYLLYLEEIENDGNNDPALGILEVFLRHYGEIVTRFNRRWNAIPSFYFEQILQVKGRNAQPDTVWLTMEKSVGVGDIRVKKGTAFVAGRREDGSPYCYRSTEEVQVTGLCLTDVCSYLLKRDPERFPAARLGYVTDVLKNVLDCTGAAQPQEMFGGSGSKSETIGLMIESPLFLTEEGDRHIDLNFRMTVESRSFFEHLVQETGSIEQIADAEILHKILCDAFYLEISSADGWLPVPGYLLTYDGQGTLQLRFRLQEHLPAIVACTGEKQGCTTSMPVLKILMNRNAWLFPYSWAKAVHFDRLQIRTEVCGLTRLKIYNATGEQDISIPVYPFGVQPEQGAWMVFGSYEMAVKPLKQVGLVCRWQQLPEHPEGWYGYYREYQQGINNTSFRIRTEWLEEKKWQAQELNRQCLFMAREEEELLPAVPLAVESRITCQLRGKQAAFSLPEDFYAYGRTGSGFFRVVLEAPAMGFGHAVYRQVFADVMIRNSRRRHPLPLPALPFSPLAEGFSLNYTATEELCFAAGQEWGTTRLAHICPLGSPDETAKKPDKPFAFADGPESTGHLLFGFRGTAGQEKIRFYVELAPLQREIDLRDRETEDTKEPRWYMWEGKKWNVLQTGALLRDTTGYFMNSGLIEILLPQPVSEYQLDEEGKFWLCAAFEGKVISRPAIRGIYVNAVEVAGDVPDGEVSADWISGLAEGSITAAYEDLPGISRITQITKGKGGRPAEGRQEIQRRIPERIAHRNRAVLPADYEQLVLEHFRQVAKVKCLPGLDTKGMDRKGVVTLVILPHDAGNPRPLADHRLLLDIERFVEKKCGAFVLVDAVNPVYEEMIVRCRMVLEQQIISGELVDKLSRKIDAGIAPWEAIGGLAVFNHRFSLKSLQNIIEEEPGIAALQGLSVLHITAGGKQVYRLNEYHPGQSGEQMIGGSQPWCIAVPSPKHMIEIGRGWEGKTGIGKLEIGHTWIIE